MASIFADVEVGPQIEVFALNKAFQDDPSSVKVNLGVGGKLFTFIILFAKINQVILHTHTHNLHSFLNAQPQFRTNYSNTIEIQRNDKVTKVTQGHFNRIL